MKVKVNRQLNGGVYNVSFEVGDFTTEELSKMSSFGVPNIALEWFNPPPQGRTSGTVPLNQITKRYSAAFGTEVQARSYEEKVLGQIKAAMERLRTSRDSFSSSDEVSF